jgi:hypothetical protein
VLWFIRAKIFSRMKLFTLLLTFGFYQAFAQDIEIVLVGTTHQFKTKWLQNQNFEFLIQKWKDYKPDIICIESIPVWDTVSLMQVRKSSLESAAQLKMEKNIVADNIDSLITYYKKLVQNKPDQLTNRSILANLLYARYDFWNAYYHWFTLEQKLQQKIGYDSSLIQTFALDSIHKRIYARHLSSEFGNMIFPLAQKLNHPYLYNIDDRADDKLFQSLTLPIAKRLLLNLKLFKALRIYRQLRKQTEAAEQEGRIMQHINSPEFYQKISKLLDELPVRLVRSKKAAQYKNLWDNRNRRMAERIIGESQKAQAKKVIAFFGAAHLEFIKRELEKTPAIKVTMLHEMN